MSVTDAGIRISSFPQGSNRLDFTTRLAGTRLAGTRLSDLMLRARWITSCKVENLPWCRRPLLRGTTLGNGLGCGSAD